MKIKKIYEKSITRDQINDLMSDIYYDNVPIELGLSNNFTIKTNIDNIYFYSKDKKKCEAYLKGKNIIYDIFI